MISISELRPLLALADDHLILGQRTAELCGSAPTLEEELALANLGLDLIGQARALYTHIANLEGAGRTEDDLAFLREEHEYLCLLLVEQPNEDFAFTTLKNLFFSSFMVPYWQQARSSSDLAFAGIANQAEKESLYHRRHAAEWTIRLGDGTAESHARMVSAVEALWPYCGELFETDVGERAAVEQGVLPDRAGIRGEWGSFISEVFSRAALELPQTLSQHHRGGRNGVHSEHFGHLLVELQYLQRTHPGAQW